MLFSTDPGANIIIVNHEPPITELETTVHASIKCGALTIYTVDSHITESDEIQILDIKDKDLRKAAKETHASFGMVRKDNGERMRESVFICHSETEEGYKIDRISANISAHNYVITDNSVDIFGSVFPEMYALDSPLVRIYSTNETTGVIKEVLYYADTMEPRAKYFEPTHPKYEKLSGYRKSLFIPFHTGGRFTTKVSITPSTKIVLSKKYVQNMIRSVKSIENVADLIKFYFSMSPDAFQKINMNDVVQFEDTEEGLDEVLKFIEENAKASNGYATKWIFLGFHYPTLYALREAADKAAESTRPAKPKFSSPEYGGSKPNRSEKPRKDYNKPRKDEEDVKIVAELQDAMDLSMLNLDQPTEKPSRAARRRNGNKKRDYHNKYGY